MSQANFNVIHGCDISISGHIDEFAGIFAPLEEHFIGFKNKDIIPARIRTTCPKRMAAKCNINCPRAVYGIQSGHKISFKINKRM